jgi:hypothetical protein
MKHYLQGEIATVNNGVFFGNQCEVLFSRKRKSLAFRCIDRKEGYMYKPEKRTNTTPYNSTQEKET